MNLFIPQSVNVDLDLIRSFGETYIVKRDGGWPMALFANRGHVLIDTNSELFDYWEVRGGRTILWPTNDNELSQFSQVAVDYVRERLELFKCLDDSRLVIETPLPEKSMHPNVVSDWRTKAKAVKHFRAAVAILTKEGLNRDIDPPMFDSAEVRIVIYLGPRQKKSDPDNVIAWFKAAFDGLQDAGLLSHDRELIHLPPVQCGDDRKNPRAEIHFQPLG